ncbi:hypothetical protein K488DRAFT_87675 [Vararia minispora EC-137]|uniref:Uncharacterized protein n=1 Tax=Vararia minispora EC-137 TaxID=1314806 RepID=A0ACB8QFC3_9AGAM|nr:hypothetical protein K488DRAFT_87675 [Vararia minispora EC-137]
MSQYIRTRYSPVIPQLVHLFHQVTRNPLLFPPLSPPSPPQPSLSLTTLFADDTTVYLNAQDSWASLHAILDKWCEVSGAHFNINKTVIIPVGPTPYRKTLQETRTLHAGDLPIPIHIKILGDGTFTRILGAFLGNEVNLLDVWAPRVSNIVAFFDRYSSGKRIHPDLMSRRHTANQKVMATTQYSTVAQSMPETIVKRLESLTYTFLWQGSRPSINRTTLQLPLDQGGLATPNIRARNTAIALRHLQRYLAEDNRPRWALLADTLLASDTPTDEANIDPIAKINFFLQTWRTRQRGSGLPPTLRAMLLATKSTGIAVDTISPSPQLNLALPAWYHLGIGRKTLHILQRSATATCIRHSHRVRTVSDLVIFTARSRRTANRDAIPLHSDIQACACDACNLDRAHPTNCQYPVQCVRIANELFQRIQNTKWNPLPLNPDPPVEAPNARLAPNADDAGPAAPLTVTFDALLPSANITTEALRIYTTKEHICHTPPRICRRQALNIVPSPVWIVASPSSASLPEAPIWIVCLIYRDEDDPRNIALRLAHPALKNITDASIAGAVISIRYSLPTHPIHIFTTNSTLFNAVRNDLQVWENEDLAYTSRPDLWRPLLSQLREHLAPVHVSHVTEQDVVWAAERARELRTQRLTRTQLDLTWNPSLVLSGARFCHLSQAQLTTMINLRHHRTNPRRPAPSIDSVRGSLTDINGTAPSQEEVWLSIWNRDLYRVTSDFLWRVLRRSYKIGRYWLNIPGFEHRATCQVCATSESWDHILLHCNAPGPATIWDAVGNFLRIRIPTLPPLSLDLILGCALINPADGGPLSDASTQRLFRITIAESARLIWILRCERVIQNKTTSHNSALNRWTAMMDSRLQLDVAMTSRTLGRFALPRTLVLNTWSRVIRLDGPLTETDWVHHKGVLVGIQVPEADAQRPWRRPAR